MELLLNYSVFQAVFAIAVSVAGYAKYGSKGRILPYRINEKGRERILITALKGSGFFHLPLGVMKIVSGLFLFLSEAMDKEPQITPQWIKPIVNE